MNGAEVGLRIIDIFIPMCGNKERKTCSYENYVVVTCKYLLVLICY